MQTLTNRDLTVPDGFRYVHAETGHVSSALDWYTWQGHIKEHRRANNLPPISPEEADNQLCQTVPPEWCEHAENDRSWVNTRLSWNDVWQAAKAYLELAITGKTVSQIEADRRARLCAGCYLQVPLQGCGACQQLAQLFTGHIAQQKTSYDPFLDRKVCAACKCPTKGIVHFPLSILEQHDSVEQQAAFAPFCWRNKLGENYMPEAI